MPKRVYKFTSARHAISNVSDRRLKLSTIDDLNDPFDLASLDTTEPHVTQARDALVIHFRQNFGLLCFSRNWDNLLLWSHYGASHTGVCLGFDIPDDDPKNRYGTDVLYQPNLIQIRHPDDVNFDLAERLFRTKHESWSYEQEVRLFLKLNDLPDSKGLLWANFGPGLELKEIIAGVQCSPDDLKALGDVLKSYGDTVQCSWAYMRPDAFLLVKHNFPPPWFDRPA
jgi:hypothetical protein